MKKKNLKNLFLSVLFAGGFITLAQANGNGNGNDNAIPFQPQLLNTGAMNVAGDMYVQGDIQMFSVPSAPNRVVVVRHNGNTHLTGSFWQDAVGNVFEVPQESRNWDAGYRNAPRGVTSSTGTIHFVNPPHEGVGLPVPGQRTIAPRVRDREDDGFNRVNDYIAFPHIEIATRDVIVVPPHMGMDARTIRRSTNELAEQREDGTYDDGVIILRSEVDGDVQWNASLRITNSVENGDEGINELTGNDARFVAPDAVIVELYVYRFRETGALQPTTVATLMPFSPPYWEMRAGYFAGNWVRRPVFEQNINSVRSPLGNRSHIDAQPAQSIIDKVVYARTPMGFQARQESFGFMLRPLPEITFHENGTRQAYLVQLLPQTYVGDETHLLYLTDGHHNDESINMFVFDGHPFPSSPIGRRPDRELFAGHPVLREAGTINNSMQNLLAGNSFTAGLNTQDIAEYLATRENITEIWIFPHGETRYVEHPLTNLNIDVSFPDIQAMGVFMVRASGNTGGDIVIGPRFQTHTGGIALKPITPAPAPAAGLRSMQRSNSLTLALTPENNPLIFSRTEILFNENASIDADNLDIAVTVGSSMFQLSGTNDAATRLQRNALPYTAEKALLRVEAPPVFKNNVAGSEMWVTLTALDVDNFAADMVLLYDRQTGHFIQDLRANNRYTFFLSPNDDPNRFEVRFTPRNDSTTDIDDVQVANWSVFNDRNELTVSGLSSSLIGETMRIFNAAGVLHIQQPISSTVEHINIQNLPSGVYLITIQGRTERFVK